MWGRGVLTCTTSAPGLRAASPQSKPMSNPHSRGFGCGFAGSQSNSATSPRAASLLRATATQLDSMPKGSKPRSSSCRASASGCAPSAPSTPSVPPLLASTARPPPPRACRCRLARTRLRVRRPRQRACAKVGAGGQLIKHSPGASYNPKPDPSQRACTKTVSSVMTRNMFRTWPALGLS